MDAAHGTQLNHCDWLEGSLLTYQYCKDQYQDKDYEMIYCAEKENLCTGVYVCLCRYVVLPRPLCLEKGQKYTVEMLLARYSSNDRHHHPNMLIDSVSILVSNTHTPGLS